MIKIYSNIIESDYFPDNTLSLKLKDNIIDYMYPNHTIKITWAFDNNEEMSTLYFLVRHLKNIFKSYRIELFMPYIPNARMDRVKSKNEIFTLKYFCDFINDLKFDEVYVLDPHSNVSDALINNIRYIEYESIIVDLVANLEFEKDNSILFFPDEGSMKRYSNISQKCKVPYAFGIKNRDWNTGKILDFEVHGELPDVDNYNALIIDDICSKGGTFYHSAKALKMFGAGKIYLYINHCENSILKGEFGEDKIALLSTMRKENYYGLSSIYNKIKEFKKTFKCR